MEECYISNLLDLNETIAAELFDGLTYPWEALAGIKEFILKLGPTLDPEIFEKRGEDVWVAKSAKVFPSAYIGGPCIIDEEAEIRHGAFIRGSAIVGKKAVVGNSTELKNAVMFNGAQSPHYNYVGDSILGFKAHTGAGVILSNLKSDGKNIVVHNRNGEGFETGLRKFGAILGDHADCGCNSVLNPGTVAGRGCRIYPRSCVRGVVPAAHIFKSQEEVVPIKE